MELELLLPLLDFSDSNNITTAGLLKRLELACSGKTYTTRLHSKTTSFSFLIPEPQMTEQVTKCICFALANSPDANGFQYEQKFLKGVQFGALKIWVQFPQNFCIDLTQYESALVTNTVQNS